MHYIIMPLTYHIIKTHLQDRLRRPHLADLFSRSFINKIKKFSTKNQNEEISLDDLAELVNIFFDHHQTQNAIKLADSIRNALWLNLNVKEEALNICNNIMQNILQLWPSETRNNQQLAHVFLTIAAYGASDSFESFSKNITLFISKIEHSKHNIQPTLEMMSLIFKVNIKDILTYADALLTLNATSNADENTSFDREMIIDMDPKQVEALNLFISMEDSVQQRKKNIPAIRKNLLFLDKENKKNIGIYLRILGYLKKKIQHKWVYFPNKEFTQLYSIIASHAKKASDFIEVIDGVADLLNHLNCSIEYELSKAFDFLKKEILGPDASREIALACYNFIFLGDTNHVPTHLYIIKTLKTRKYQRQDSIAQTNPDEYIARTAEIDDILTLLKHLGLLEIAPPQIVEKDWIIFIKSFYTEIYEKIGDILKARDQIPEKFAKHIGEQAIYVMIQYAGVFFEAAKKKFSDTGFWEEEILKKPKSGTALTDLLMAQIIDEEPCQSYAEAPDKNYFLYTLKAISNTAKYTYNDNDYICECFESQPSYLHPMDLLNAFRILKNNGLLEPQSTPVVAKRNRKVIFSSINLYHKNSDHIQRIAEALALLKISNLLEPESTAEIAQTCRDEILYEEGKHAKERAELLIALRDAEVLSPGLMIENNRATLQKIAESTNPILKSLFQNRNALQTSSAAAGRIEINYIRLAAKIYPEARFYTSTFEKIEDQTILELCQHQYVAKLYQKIFHYNAVTKLNTEERLLFINNMLRYGGQYFTIETKEQCENYKDYISVIFGTNAFSGALTKVLDSLYKDTSEAEVAYLSLRDILEEKKRALDNLLRYRRTMKGEKITTKETLCIQNCLRFFLNDIDFDFCQIADNFKYINFAEVFMNCAILHAYLLEPSLISISSSLSATAENIIQKLLPYHHQFLNYIVECLYQHVTLSTIVRQKLCAYLAEMLDELMQDPTENAGYFAELFYDDFGKKEFGGLYLLIKLFEIKQKLLHKLKNKEKEKPLDLWPIIQEGRFFKNVTAKVYSFNKYIEEADNPEELAQLISEEAINEPAKTMGLNRQKCLFFIPPLTLSGSYSRALTSKGC